MQTLENSLEAWTSVSCTTDVPTAPETEPQAQPSAEPLDQVTPSLSQPQTTPPRPPQRKAKGKHGCHVLGFGCQPHCFLFKIVCCVHTLCAKGSYNFKHVKTFNRPMFRVLVITRSTISCAI